VLDDVATGAVQYLSQYSDVTDLLGALSDTDPIIPNRGRPWIFSGVQGDILVTIEGSSQAGLNCHYGGGWAVPDPLTTPRFMRLGIDIWVDPSRDSGNNIQESSGTTQQRGNSIFDAIQNRLQIKDPDQGMWGNLRVVGCQLLSEPANWTAVNYGDHALMATAWWGVLVFGSDAGIPV
jgi:hypothetical protein